MVLAFLGRVQVWELYLMNTLVAAGFWMFWPTITALIQELTPEGEFVHSNTFLLAGVQGGWLIAGAVVGFVYEHIGLGGVLLIDVSTYFVSFACYFAVRQGRHVVPRAVELRHDWRRRKPRLDAFFARCAKGSTFLRGHPSVVFLGTSWALFLGAMMTGVVVTAPLSDRVVPRRSDWLRMAERRMGRGRVPERGLYAPWLLARAGVRASDRGLDAAADVGHGAGSLFAVAGARRVGFTGLMGSARGISGVAMNTSLMEQVPPHFMGRVQNTFYFFGMLLQMTLALTVGAVSVARESGGRLWGDRGSVCGRVWQRVLADQSSTGHGDGGKLGCRWLRVLVSRL